MDYILNFKWQKFSVPHDEIYVDVFENKLFLRRVILPAESVSIDIDNVQPNSFFYLNIYPVNGGSIYDNLKFTTTEKTILAEKPTISIPEVIINHQKFEFNNNEVNYNVHGKSCVLNLGDRINDIEYEIRSNSSEHLFSGVSDRNSITINNSYNLRGLDIVINDGEEKKIKLNYPEPEVNFVSINRYGSDSEHVYLNIEPIYYIPPNKITLKIINQDKDVIFNKSLFTVNKVPVKYPRSNCSDIIIHTFDLIGQGKDFFLEKSIDY